MAKWTKDDDAKGGFGGSELKQVEAHNMGLIEQAEVNQGLLEDAGWQYNRSNGLWRKPGGSWQELNLGAADMGVHL